MLRIGLPSLVNEDFNSSRAFSVYPNPSSSILFVKNKNNAILENIAISDILGKNIKVNDYENGIDISALRKGIYFLCFSINDNKYNYKFIKS